VPIENVPNSLSRERPPLAPYDPPDPAPHSAPWGRALKEVGCGPMGRHHGLANSPVYKII
jgi:hypothetical protein